jgi:hypothetical protein
LHEDRRFGKEISWGSGKRGRRKERREGESREAKQEVLKTFHFLTLDVFEGVIDLNSLRLSITRSQNKRDLIEWQPHLRGLLLASITFL